MNKQELQKRRERLQRRFLELATDFEGVHDMPFSEHADFVVYASQDLIDEDLVIFELGKLVGAANAHGIPIEQVLRGPRRRVAKSARSKSA